MFKLTNESFWCVGIEKVKNILLSNSGEVCDVLAVLKFDEFDIELTDRGFSDGERHFDYYCCKNSNGEWHSLDSVDFGSKMPYEFDTDEELRADMKRQLEKFLLDRA